MKQRITEKIFSTFAWNTEILNQASIATDKFSDKIFEMSFGHEMGGRRYLGSEQHVQAVNASSKVEESLVHRVELVVEEHSGPLQGTNCANVTVVELKREALGWDEVINRVEEVSLVVVILALCQVEVAIVERVSEKLEVLELACI